MLEIRRFVYAPALLEDLENRIEVRVAASDLTGRVGQVEARKVTARDVVRKVGRRQPQ